MKNKICILYASHDGQTKKICEYIDGILIENESFTEIYPIHGFNQPLKEFDSIVIGASIRYGKHDKAIIDFINSNQSQLENMKTAFFSVNLVARKQEKNTPETNPYFIKFMDSITWVPNLTGVFAGRLDYRAYSFFDRLMIKLIMKMTKGPTKTDEPIEYTDWEKVKKFSQRVLEI